MTTQTSTHPLTPWEPDDYAPLVTFTGARKLAASGVAPLVALARGYETLENSQVRDFAKHHQLGSANSRAHSQVLGATKEGEAMVLHWYRADLNAQMHESGLFPASSSMQLRPSHPRTNPGTGKIVKYENLAGSESVIDTNPGTPAEWFTSSPRLLITEGVLKGDAALTALLRANGVGDDELNPQGRMSRTDAVTRLRELMMKVPAHNRVTILSFVGVGNWKNNDVWVSLRLADRELLLAFDGDIDSNWNVWSQANNLWGFARGRKANVKLVDLSVDLDGELLELTSGSAKTDKVGIDDFLARHGDWNDILDRLRLELPDAPARSRDDVPTGTWKVSEDGTSVQEFTAGAVGFDGKPGPGQWELRYNIGGRVVTVETHRAPTDLEIETARFGEGVDEAEASAMTTCRIELKWINDDDTPAQAVVTGPSTILMYPPSEWDKKKAVIPQNLLLHSEWPPRKGLEWLSAIKDNKEIPVAENVSWTTMGWVPVENSTVCSFISGRTVISPSKHDQDRTLPGVGETALPGAAKFSLPSIPGDILSDEWKTQVRADLNNLFKHYIELAPWNDINVAGVVMAAGLRPSVPVACTTCLWVQGPPGQGKSWTVAQILAFHQARKTWTNKSLPGSMKDTNASVEQALSQTNIWVMDDLAPSADAKQSALEMAKSGDIIRNVHNRTAKRRSGTELRAREVFTPRALLIATAENEHSINSVRDRTIILNLDKNSLRDGVVETMNDFRDHSGTPGRLMTASVQAMQHLAVLNGWTEMIEQVEVLKGNFAAAARETIAEAKVEGKSDQRHVEMAVDLMLGLAPLHILAEMVGATEILALFNPEDESNLPQRIAKIVMAGFATQGEATPGRATLDAIRHALLTGRAHLLNASDPNTPPISGDHAGTNRLLGWQQDGQDKFRPAGVAIGYITAAAGDTAVDVVMFDHKAAFEIASRWSPALLPPGTAASTSFGSLWNEGLIHPHYASRGRDGSRVNKMFRVDGRPMRGVPVHLDTLLGNSDG